MKNKILSNIKKIVSENFKFWEVIILMGLTAVIGISIGGIIAKKNYSFSATDNNSANALESFINNYNYIINNYYGEVEEKKLLDKALETILEEIGDPYAAYMDETEANNFNIYLNGSYKGLGVEIAMLNSTGELIITNIFDDSPAIKVGLQVGDILKKYNDESLDGITSADFSKKIKESKENFTLTVLRDNEELTFTVNLDTIILKSVSAELLENKIGYVYISVFANNTYEQLKKSLEDLQKEGMESLIIDLRGNSGGYLSSVDSILSLFLDSKHVIYQIQDKTSTKKFYSKGKETVEYDIVILTNEGSASASEIMTATLKEQLGAISVGKKTYGKGSAQKLHTMSDGTNFKFTTQKWLTPSGVSIDQVGVDVDYEVDIAEEYFKEPIRENDNQLKYAIELLNNN